MKRGNRHTRAIKQFVDDETPLSAHSLRQLTTIIVDTPSLISDHYHFVGAWSNDMESGEVIAIATHALTGATSTKPCAIRACLPPPIQAGYPPIATTDHTLTWASWHHGGDYETYWFGDITTLLHYADITDTEREQLMLKARKAIAEGQLAYAVGLSLTPGLPRTPQLVMTQVGLIFVTPSVHSGTISAIHDIKKQGIAIIYASHDDTYTVTAVAQLVGVAAKNETAITMTTGRVKAMQHTLYASATPAAIHQLVASLPSKSSLKVTGRITDFWQAAHPLIDD